MIYYISIFLCLLVFVKIVKENKQDRWIELEFIWLILTFIPMVNTILIMIISLGVIYEKLRTKGDCTNEKNNNRN